MTRMTSQSVPDDTAVAIPAGGCAAPHRVSPFAQSLRPAQTHPAAPTQAVRCRAEDWRYENRDPHAAAYRKIRLVRADAGPFLRFRSRWWCAPLFRGVAALLPPFAAGLSKCSRTF